jgi:4-alpha-glucanotransferase
LCSEGIHWGLIRLALGSVADTAIFPFQDILGLGTDTRMNMPGLAEGNWKWRYRSEAVNSELSDRIKYLTYLYGRAPREH